MNWEKLEKEADGLISLGVILTIYALLLFLLFGFFNEGRPGVLSDAVSAAIYFGVTWVLLGIILRALTLLRKKRKRS